ncbi:hypothetical protein [Dongia sp.]|uniref:hypothetical protein n=1 Tax=Dongia sp. TaxID=1977262 RepID=UPI0035B195C9
MKQSHPGISLPIYRLVLLLLFAAGLLFYNLIQLHHDVAWYVYCNFRQLEGIRPYIDIIEVSPPITFYLTLLPVVVSAVTGLPVKFCVTFFVLALSAISLLLAMSFDKMASPGERRWKTIAIAAVMLIVPVAVFGQREHFAVILGLPYFYASAARLRGMEVKPGTAIIAGLMAGIGLSIKHYFLLAPLMVEAYLIFATGSLRVLFRWEIYAATAAGLLYATFVLLVHPEYLSVSVPLILAAYSAYTLPLWLVAAQPAALPMILGIGFFFLARRYIGQVGSADLLFVAALAFAACYFWQGKGWAYHALPANLTLAIASVELASLTLADRASARKISVRQRYTLPLAPLLLIFLQTAQSGYYRNQFAEDAVGYVKRYAEGGNVFMMSSNLSTGFPLVLDSGARWASRYATQWLLPEILRGRQMEATLNEKRRTELAWLARIDFDSTVEDFEKLRPALVFVDLTYQDRPTRIYNGISVDMIAYYIQDRRFAEIWQQYEKVDTISSFLSDESRRFDVWVRRSPQQQ